MLKVSFISPSTCKQARVCWKTRAMKLFRSGLLTRRKSYSGSLMRSTPSLQVTTWPGNVRELEHTLKSCLTALDGESTLYRQHLSPYFILNYNNSMEKRQDEKDIITSTPPMKILKKPSRLSIRSSMTSSIWMMNRTDKLLV
jgi:transcriptional regulator with PAS, ATPase and Fis domain